MKRRMKTGKGGSKKKKKWFSGRGGSSSDEKKPLGQGKNRHFCEMNKKWRKNGDGNRDLVHPPNPIKGGKRWGKRGKGGKGGKLVRFKMQWEKRKPSREAVRVNFGAGWGGGDNPKLHVGKWRSKVLN